MAPKLTRTDVDALIAEVERYLAAVEIFRAAGCEPRWRFEYPPTGLTKYDGSDALTAR